MLGGLISGVDSTQVLNFKNISWFLLFVKTCIRDKKRSGSPSVGDKIDFSTGPV